MRSPVWLEKFTNFPKPLKRKTENHFSSRNSKSLRIFESRLFSKWYHAVLLCLGNPEHAIVALYGLYQVVWLRPCVWESILKCQSPSSIPVLGPLILTSFLVLLCIVMIVYHHLPSLNERIPESCFLIVLGIFIGVFVHFVNEHPNHSVKMIHQDSEDHTVKTFENMR